MDEHQKPRTLAYVRVSTETQDLEKDKEQILQYVENRHLPVDIIWFEDVAKSGTISWEQRKIKDLVDQARKGDVAVTTEVSRLARNMNQVSNIMEALGKKDVLCHVIKNALTLDGNSAHSAMMASMCAYVAQMERDLISQRTKDALATRKRNGVKLGRPPGTYASKLDPHLTQILKWLADGVSKAEVARKLNTSPGNLNMYFKKRCITPIRPLRKTIESSKNAS